MSWGTRTGVTQAAFRDILDVRLVRWLYDFSTMEFPEAASQTFKAGQPVKLVNGAVTACVDNDTVWAGIPVRDATGVTGIPMPLLVADRGKVWIVKCLTAPVAANVGTDFNVDLTSSVYSLDLSSSAQPFFRIIELPNGFATAGNENFNKAYVVAADAAIQIK